jgi:DNA polymerase (family 10)
VLASSEVDILKAGKLDLDDEVLAQLDVVLVSIHSYMNLERAEMTDRILAAIENPYTQIIAHPTGRLLLHRDAYAYDMERILDAARARGIAMECNASPERLDLHDTHLRMAKERGVKIVISTDAHSTLGLSAMCYGLQMARRGWLENKDVLNTFPLNQFLAALRAKPGAAAQTETLAAASNGKGSSRKAK